MLPHELQNDLRQRILENRKHTKVRSALPKWSFLDAYHKFL